MTHPVIASLENPMIGMTDDRSPALLRRPKHTLRSYLPLPSFTPLPQGKISEPPTLCSIPYPRSPSRLAAIYDRRNSNPDRGVERTQEKSVLSSVSRSAELRGWIERTGTNNTSTSGGRYRLGRGPGRMSDIGDKVYR